MKLRALLVLVKNTIFFELTKHIGMKNFSKTIEIIEYMSTNSNKYPLTLLISSVFYFLINSFYIILLKIKEKRQKLWA